MTVTQRLIHSRFPVSYVYFVCLCPMCLFRVVTLINTIILHVSALLDDRLT